MAKAFKLGEFELFWLEGGVFEIDGGSLFGVVPKVLWEKKCAATPDNYIRVADSAILVKAPDGNILIETGLGNKLTEKQKKIFRLREEWNIPAALKKLGLSRHNIKHVVLTHCDFDHAGGITMHTDKNEVTLTFPNAIHYIQKSEWEDVCKPNTRAACSYWPVNFKGLQEGKNLFLVDGEHEIIPGVRLIHTGGHTRGHQAVWLKSGGEAALHLGDLMPTTAYSNPLWISAYDNFPLDSVAIKETILPKAFHDNVWFLFYHDSETHACRFDEEGNVANSFSYK